MFCDGKIYSHGTIKPLQTSHVNVLQEMPRLKNIHRNYPEFVNRNK